MPKDERPDAELDDLPVVARPLQEYVGRNLRAYRRHKGITQERAAELLGFDDFTELSGPRDLAKIFDTVEYAKWKSFRESEDSRYVGLAMPRVLA